MVFHWSVSDSKSPNVSKTLMNILVHLNNAVVLVLILPQISKSYSFFTRILGSRYMHTNYHCYHSHASVPEIFF